MNGDEDLGMDIVMKGEHYHIAQQALQKQTVPLAGRLFASGMNGDEDLGLDIIMKGEYYHIAQNDVKVSSQSASKFFADGMNGDEDLGLDIIMKGEHYHIAQKDLSKSKIPVNMKFFATGMDGDEDLGLDIMMQGVHYHIVQKRADTFVQPEQKSFVQLKDIDENAELAQAYLEQQFPDDYPKPPAPAKAMPKGPSAEEIQQKERKELIEYAEGVAEQAKSYQNEIIEKQVDKKEAKELSKMGYEEKFVPEYAKGDFAPLGRH